MSRENTVVALLELFSFLDSPAEPVFSRSMFGGHLIYCGEVAFALVKDGNVYLKTDGLNRENFRSAGGQPFVNSRGVIMSFWTPPPGSLDREEKIKPWVHSAFSAAKRNLKTKKRKS